MLLTDRGIRAAESKATAYRLADGDGLALLVQPNGKKLWRFDYRLHGVRRTLSMGIYPDVTLATARERRREARQLVAKGIDPSAERQRQARQAQVSATAATFKALAGEWLDRQQDVTTPGTDERNRTILRLYAFPQFGRLPVAQIEPPDVLAMLQVIERKGRRDTAHRVKQLCGQIFRYGILTGRVTRDPTSDLRGALLPVVKRHYAAITDPKALGTLLVALEGLQGFSLASVALRLLPYLFCRPGELRHAEWTEVDLDAAMWRIPAAKMKMRDAHLVPLSTQAVALFEEAKSYETGSRYVFPSHRANDQPLSDMALTMLMRRCGYGTGTATPHGFRATARTLLDEVLRFPPDAIEVQLAHVVRGPLGGTYNRSRYIEQRVAMMSAWADYLDTLRAQAMG